MSKFEPGKTYTTRSACDHNCIFSMTVIRRTAKSIWVDVKHFRENKQLRIKEYNGVETVAPLGTYSMSPVISAE